MQKTTHVNIGGRAFVCDQEAYDVIRRYLDRCARRLANNPDKDEIVQDIEQSVAEHLKESLKTEVVDKKLAEATIEAIGEVESDDAESASSETAESVRGFFERFRYIEFDKSRKIIFGTAAGIAKEFNVDPLLIRLGFLLLCFAQGWGLVLYGLVSLYVYFKPSPHFTAQELIEEAKKDVRLKKYERVLRSFVTVITTIVRISVGAVALVVFLAGSIGLATLLMYLITDPQKLNIIGAYRDWLQVLWIVSCGLLIIIPSFMVLMAAMRPRKRKSIRAGLVLTILLLASIIGAGASSAVAIPRLRTWAIDHDIKNDYLYVTKLENKPVSVCFSLNGNCGPLVDSGFVQNSVCSYPTFSGEKIESLGMLRYRSFGTDWILKTKNVPFPVSDETVCKVVQELYKEYPYSSIIFTDRPYTDTLMYHSEVNGYATDTPVYQLDYLIADR